jgi:hypothetical protein
MEMNLRKSSENDIGYFFDEELDIMSKLIKDGIIIEKNFFDNTSNALYVYSVERITTMLDETHEITTPSLKLALRCYGEKSTEEDERIALACFYEMAETIVATVFEDFDNSSEMFMPVRINNMVILTGYVKYDEGIVLVLGKTAETEPRNDLYTLCTGICALLHACCMLMSYGATTAPSLSLDGYIPLDVSNLLAKAIRKWFDDEPPILKPWIEKVAQYEAKFKIQELIKEWKARRGLQ